jgi:hypothetical protein
LTPFTPDDSTFDLDTIRATEVNPQAVLSCPSTKPPRQRRGEAFLRGPVPWLWVQAAMRLPGRALHVGILLWKEAGCRKSRTVRLRLTASHDYGIHPDTLNRGLEALLAAGLVAVRRRPGHPPEVTLLDARETMEGVDG